MYMGIPPFRREKERYTSLLKRRGTNRLLPFPTTPYIHIIPWRCPLVYIAAIRNNKKTAVNRTAALTKRIKTVTI